jgi:putative Mg2+ transporter-C (MgtC) family protein
MFTADIATTFPIETPGISIQQMVLRLGIAAVFGAVIGYERELRGRAAGLRTTMLASMAGCAASILSAWIYYDVDVGNIPGTWRPDPARLAQGVLAGMGFLGAGVIVREGKIIRGVTTAAVLWFVTILGLILGSGHYTLAILAWGFAMMALLMVPMVERYVPSDWYGSITINVNESGVTDMQIRQTIEDMGVVIKETGYDLDVTGANRTLKIAIKYNRGNLIKLSTEMKERLSKLPGVTRVQWQAAA